MNQPSDLRRPSCASWTALPLAVSAVLAACGGGGSTTATVAVEAAQPASAPVIAKLSGTVAVGAPIAGGVLRVIDASGTVIASDVPIDATGNYAEVALTGTAPWRLEACGYAGANYLCVYSVANAAGTANVTPLTTATVLLAAAQSPAALMTGTAPALTSTSLATAQAQLRTGLSSVLASAGVSSSIDFVSAPLNAGSRTGYDKLLDAVGITTGQDATPFVQITPRLGQGNLYLEQGTTSGTVTADAGASALPLAGLETLFRNMSASLASPAACADTDIGIARSLAPNAQMQLGDDGSSAQGAAAVADGLCHFFGGGDADDGPPWTSHLLSPTLGHCDLSSAAPVCGVSFVIQTPDGSVQSVGGGMGVTYVGGAWKFLGDLLPIGISATAKAQRTVRLDGNDPAPQYDRALAFEVSAANGVACAKVSQHDETGALTTMAYYKRHTGAAQQARLSLWTSDGNGWGASLDPNVGATRSTDDTWLALPEGTQGDAVIRNFYRGGRAVNVALYGDNACTVPFPVNGKSDFEVDVDGVPPVWSAMPSLPWPELTADTKAAVLALSLDSGASRTFVASWTFDHGPMSINGITVCGDRGACGDGNSGRIGESNARGNVRSASVALHNTGNPVGANDNKTFALYGRNGEGVGLEANFSACVGSPAGESCH